MTLRVNLEVVPFGNEEQIYPIFRLDISNLGMVRNDGFGHVVCRYSVKKFRYLNETMRRIFKTSEEWELEKEALIEEHDRRDGAIELVRKACEISEIYEGSDV